MNLGSKVRSINMPKEKEGEEKELSEPSRRKVSAKTVASSSI